MPRSLGALFALAATGCATLGASRSPPVTVDVVALDVPRLGPQSGEAYVTLNVASGGEEVIVRRTTLTLDLQGNRIAEALLATNDQKVPAKSAVKIRHDLPLSIRAIPQPIANSMARGEALDLFVSGQLSVTTPRGEATVPFEAMRSVRPMASEAGVQP
jgi:hypothetical protein